MLRNNIEDFYKDIDKPIINQYINNNLKNLLELSTITDLYVFTKKNNNWKLKNKRQLLKECDIKRKIKIKEVSTTINGLLKNKSCEITKKIKMENDNLFKYIEDIDNFIDIIEKTYSPVPPLADNLFIEIFSN